MSVAAVKIEVRYRPLDTIGAWQYKTVAPGEGSVDLPGLERGVTYQIEARSVALSGAASPWVGQTHVVSSTAVAPLAPAINPGVSLADGVHLSWTITDTQRTDVEYKVQRTPDLSGAPDPAGWADLVIIRALAYTDGVTDGVTRWYRVRAVTYLGVASAWSSDVSSRGKTVADGATVGAILGPGGNVSGAVDANLRAIVDFIQPHLNKDLNNIPDLGKFPSVTTEVRSVTNAITSPARDSVTFTAPGWFGAWVYVAGGIVDIFLDCGSNTGYLYRVDGRATLSLGQLVRVSNITTPAFTIIGTTYRGTNAASFTGWVFLEGYYANSYLALWLNGTKYIDATDSTYTPIASNNLAYGEEFNASGKIAPATSTPGSTALNSQASINPAALTRNPFTVLSYDDTLGTGAGIKVSWPAITVYNPDSTTISVPASTDSSQLATVPNPTLSSVAGGTKAARTYFVRMAYMIDGGIRGFSNEVSIAVPANSLLKCTSPASTPPWTHYCLFVSTASGTETWVGQVGADAGVLFGTDWLEPTAALVVNGPRYSAISGKGVHGFVKAGAPYNFALFFCPFYDKTLGLVRFYGDANGGSGLIAGGTSTPENVRGMYLDAHVALAAFGLTFTTITTAQGSSGLTTGGSGFGGCPIAGTHIKPLGVPCLSTREPNSKWIEIELADGRTLTATPDHPVYTDRGKTRLSRLRVGEEVVTDCGMVKVVKKTRRAFAAEKEVISMTAGHLYYANGILSHNIKIPQN